jgi:hypothetical protein
VPAEFDSLVAKLIASGDTRDEARARLVSALRDLELVVAGGATNRGLLIDVLESPAFRAGGVDTVWLDRFVATPREKEDLGAEALVAAAILTYQRKRHTARLNFYADPANASPDKAPPSVGQQLELSHAGPTTACGLRLGAWRYRVSLDGRTVGHAPRMASTPRVTLPAAPARFTTATAPGSGWKSRHAHRFGGRARVRCSPELRRWWSRRGGAEDRVESGQALSCSNHEMRSPSTPRFWCRARGLCASQPACRGG